MNYEERIRELEELITKPWDEDTVNRIKCKLQGFKEGYALGHSEAKTEIGIDGLRKEWMHEHEEMIIQQDRADLIKAVIESGSFQIKDLPYFNRLWAGAENGKLMPEATRKLYELEIIEKEKVLELIKGDKI